MSFSSDIEKFAQKTNRNTDDVLRNTFFKLFASIIRKTRVDTGRLRGNWQTSTGSPIFQETEREDNIPQFNKGGKAEAEALRVIDPTKVNYLTNNLPYAQRWEDEDGMVATSIARFKRTLSEEVRNVR